MYVTLSIVGLMNFKGVQDAGYEAVMVEERVQL